MRRLALLFAGAALWLFLAALPVLADGGPHQLAVNSGTGSSGLSGDCAACHRAHTAKAADLLKDPMPALCTNCHNGSGATTDVVDGYQFVPDSNGNPQAGTVLGALRGGGFTYALIDTSNASRISIGGVQVITFSGSPAGGTFTLKFGANTTGAITFDPTLDVTNTPSNLQANIATALVALPNVGSSITYQNSTVIGNMSPPKQNGANTWANATVSCTTNLTTCTVSFQNEMRLAAQPLMTANGSGLTGGTNPAVSVDDTTMSQVRTTAAVPTLAVASKAPTTSSHQGTGTVWGNGPQGQGNAGATGVVLDCAKCHNPHGNGQYRILNTTPGEDWNTAAGVANWTEATNAVEVAEAAPVTLTAGQVRNYTVKASATGLASGVVNGAGDYWRYKFDPSGAANWTNFYLKTDPMNTGWNGASATNKAANANVAPANTTGLMTAWCITCHTRYNGYSVDANGALSTASSAGVSSLSKQMPSDSIFMFKHGTTRIGCEQCHVSHGSNAAMSAQFSAAAKLPDGAAEDSALLKIDNRGTCNMCHEPTHTVVPGTLAGNKANIPNSSVLPAYSPNLLVKY